MKALDSPERLKSVPLGRAVMDEYRSFERVATAADVLETIVGELTNVAPEQMAAMGEGPPW